MTSLVMTGVVMTSRVMTTKGHNNKIAEAMETATRAMKIQATTVVLMELVITATRLDISK